jgi:DNA-binding LytR/AlgR family response regulator
MAIDDEPLALQQLTTYIGKVPFLELVAQCQSAVEARQFLEQDTVDAIFCDINMPDLNGMDFVKSLTVAPFIVFTTAYAEYAVEGFKHREIAEMLGIDINTSKSQFMRARGVIIKKLNELKKFKMSEL